MSVRENIKDVLQVNEGLLLSTKLSVTTKTLQASLQHPAKQTNTDSRTQI